MAVNPQFDDENLFESGATTSMDELPRLSASKETEMEQFMIRMYKQTVRPLIRKYEPFLHTHTENRTHILSSNKLKMAVNLQFEDEHGFESGGFFASTGSEMEQMIRIIKQTMWPMICSDVNVLRQEFLSRKKEESRSTSMTRNSDNMASTLGSQTLQLQFRNGISTPVYTGKQIEGKDNKPFVVALVDSNTGQIVNTGGGAAAKVEIVVIMGDYNDDEVDSWTLEDFNNKIISESKGKKILKGNTCLYLKDGIGCVDEIYFQQNSGWTRNSKYRLGAKFEDAVFATRVKEAKTESFLLKDNRCLSYCKHDIPSFSDKIWRVKKIHKRSQCYIKLRNEHIETVRDFRTLLAINQQKLQDILKVDSKIWKVIVDHAQICKDDDEWVYLYRGVTFNVSGQLTGLVIESHYVPCDKLSDDQKGYAQGLLLSSSENWKDVVSFDDEGSLINHLSPQIAFNSSQSPSNGLNFVTTQTITDHTTPITSPRAITPNLSFGCTDNVTDSGHDNDCVMGQSQSTYRSAKKQRFDHLQAAIPPVNSPGIMSSFPSMIVTEQLNSPWSFQYQEPNSVNHEQNLSGDEDISQYLDFSYSQEPRLNWMTLFKVVKWILIISKKHKRRMTESSFKPQMMIQC